MNKKLFEIYKEKQEHSKNIDVASKSLYIFVHIQKYNVSTVK